MRSIFNDLTSDSEWDKLSILKLEIFIDLKIVPLFKFKHILLLCSIIKRFKLIFEIVISKIFWFSIHLSKSEYCKYLIWWPYKSFKSFEEFRLFLTRHFNFFSWWIVTLNFLSFGNVSMILLWFWLGTRKRSFMSRTSSTHI